MRKNLPPSIIVIFILSLIYWSYLGLTTHMDIFFDSIGYESLGRMIANQGWVAYFTTGPNREPLYPLLIAASIQIGQITGLAYVKIMAFFGIIIMFSTQALTYKILRLLNVRNSICIWVLTYLALSPALNNSAFSLYSEILTYPFILGIVLSSFYIWQALIQGEKYPAFFYSILLGILLTLAALIKGVFECICPAYLIIFFFYIFLTEKEAMTKKIILFGLCVCAAAGSFYIPLTGYKWLNLHYNGNFVVTSRGSWMIYGSSARRREPMTFKRFAEALAYVPGEGVCKSLFNHKECDFWAFEETDKLGMSKVNELSSQNLSNSQINSSLLSLSLQNACHNPLQYTLFAVIEGLKMFFWESTQIGFVHYPPWLQKIYDTKLINSFLRFCISLACLIAVISLWRQTLKPQSSPLGFLIGIFIFIYIFFFSFVTNLTRYALPIAPLYLITIGIWLNQILAPKKTV